MEVEVRVLCRSPQGEPLATLLEVGGRGILLDVGWDDACTPEVLAPVREVAERVDAVLVSHADMAHLGGLPYAMARLGLEAPVYATLPASKMGQMALYDHFLSRQLGEDFATYSLDDVDAAFAKVETLQYNQRRQLALDLPRVHADGTPAARPEVTVTAYASGHSLGGAVWRVNVGGEDVVYAADINHQKDRHLEGAALEQLFDRPAVLILNSTFVSKVPVNRQQRDRAVMDSVMRALRNDGSVLVPVDPTGRLLELILVFESYWQQHNLGSYPLMLLSNTGFNTLEFAKSQLEWMNSSLTANFERTRSNAFATRYLKICHERAELNAFPRGPKVVLATMASLECGMGRELLTEWASNNRNLVLFPQRVPEGSLAHHLQHARGGQATRIKVSRRVPLQGDELREYEKRQRAARRAEEEAQRQQSGKGEGEGEGEGAADAGEGEGKGSGKAKAKAPAEAPQPLPVARSASGALARLASTSVGARSADEILMEGFAPMPDSAFPLFPFVRRKVEQNDYGQALDQEDLDRWASLKGGAAPAPRVFEREPDLPDAPLLEREEGPTKLVTVGMNLLMRAQVMASDFNGLSDEFSTRTIVRKIAPRELILLGRQPSGFVRALSEDGAASIHVAYKAEPIVVTSSAASVLFRLSDDTHTTHAKAIGGYNIARLSGQLTRAEAGDGAGEEGGGAAAAPSLPLMRPPDRSQFSRRRSCVSTTRMGLTDIKQAIAKARISSRFVSGMLVCPGRVLLSHSEDGNRLTMEGTLNSNYFKIQKRVHEQYYFA